MELYKEAERIAKLSELSGDDKGIIVQLYEHVAPYFKKAGIKKLKEAECDQRVASYYIKHFTRLQRALDQFPDSYWKHLRQNSREIYEKDRGVRNTIIVKAREARHKMWPEIKNFKAFQTKLEEKLDAKAIEEQAATEAAQMAHGFADSESSARVESQT